MIDEPEFHRRATAWFGSRLDAVGDDQWHLPTPCAEWDVRALVSHLVYENLWVPPLLRGMTIDEVGDRFDGDIAGDDPAGAWRRTAADAAGAVRALEAEGALDRTVHLSYADVPARGYVAELSADLLIHGWDLARAVGADETMDAELVQLVHAGVRAREAELKASGLFGSMVEPPADADLQTKLLAIFGRVA